MSTRAEDLQLGAYKYGWHDESKPVFEPKKGLSTDVVEEISALKDEPKWMRDLRLKAYKQFVARPMPNWGGDLSHIDFDDIFYFVRSTEKQAKTWEELPAEIKDTYDRLGIPEAEKQRLVAGVAAQYESEVVYHKIRDDLEEQGVIFLDTDSALKEHPDLFREHFTKVIPSNDNKLAALNTAVWSGGSFIWIPEGVKVDIPLQAYFRINKENMGQFERTLIIAEPGSYVHYVEGCLPAGELITMADGSQLAIDDVAVGDFVLDQNGRPARVTATQMRDYRGELFTFVPLSPENQFRVTGEHPILVVPRAEVLVKRKPRNGWKPEVDTKKLLATAPRWVDAKDVDEGDFLVFPKPKPTPAETILPLEFARLAGYYLADGSASLVNGYKALQFSMHIDDSESIDDIRRLCKDLYDSEGSVFWNEAKHEARVLVYTAAGYEAMRAHVGTRSHTKQLSGDLLRQDTTFLTHLMEAYLAGDGCIRERGKSTWFRANTTSRLLARQLQYIVARLGFYATITLDRPAGPAKILGREVMRHDMYRVQWTAGSGPKQFRDAGDYFLVPIKRREVTDFTGEVFNLDVAEPDSYLASGFAVHNCTAPIYSSDSLHSAVVEIICKPGSRVRYTTIQNWSNNVYNLVTKRAAAYEDATMEWIDGNIGCLAEGSTVTTRGGTKPIEEITPGEEILSYDDTAGELVWREVVAKRFSGEQPVREVSVGERRLRVTDNHPFYSRDTSGTSAYVRADTLTEAYVPTTSIDYGSPYKLDAADALAGGFAPALQTTDELMQSAGNLVVGTETNPSTPGGALIARELYGVLSDNGFSFAADAQRVPSWVRDLPQSQRLAFIRGVVEGSPSSIDGPLVVHLPDRAVAAQVALVFISVGIDAELGTDEGTASLTLPAADITGAAREGRPSIQIRKVEVTEHLETVPTWDIEVAGTGNFVSEGFIVHNSKLTMKYPSVHLMGRGARGEVLSVAFAGDGQHQDAGAKMVHHAPDTSSSIVSKSVSQGHGRTSYRGLVDIKEGANRVKSNVVCDALLLDETARSDTYPYMNVAEEDAAISHEASVSRIGEEQLFYLRSRGVEEFEAAAMIVRGFIEPISKELPMEYSVELNRLISLNMEGSVG